MEKVNHRPDRHENRDEQHRQEANHPRWLSDGEDRVDLEKT
jgi:hypothetical protein